MDHEPTERTYSDPDTVAREVATALAQVVGAAVAGRGRADISLTGGSMGSQVVAELAAQSPGAGTWSAVHLWWGDERFVPAGHPDRNDQQALDAGLDRLGVPPVQVHAVPGGQSAAGLDEAAAEYAAELAEHAPVGEQVAAGVRSPLFDVVLLGVGPDCHVASLFPGRPELEVTERTTVAVTDSPKPPPLRVSLTVPALRHSERVWFVVAGQDKAEAVRRARGAQDDPRLPASWVRGRSETIWWLDEGAGGLLGG